MVRKISETGCEFGRTNRLFIEDIKKNQGKIMVSLDAIQKDNKEMFNHFTERYEIMFEKMREKVPQWVVIFIGLMGALLGGLAVWAFTHR